MRLWVSHCSTSQETPVIRDCRMMKGREAMSEDKVGDLSHPAKRKDRKKGQVSSEQGLGVRVGT